MEKEKFSDTGHECLRGGLLINLSQHNGGDKTGHDVVMAGKLVAGCQIFLFISLPVGIKRLS